MDKTKIDLIVIGNPNSGKTSLIKRFIDGQSLSLEKKVIKIDSNEIHVCIWDTAGQEKFFSLTKNYFKKADGVLVIFDLTDKNSFERIEKYWIHEVIEKSDQDCSSILIGNKLDLSEQRKVQASQTNEISEKYNLKYFQTSAKTGQNVDEAIQYLVKECLKKIKCSQPRGVEVDIRRTTANGSGSSSGCFNSSKQLFSGLWEKISNNSNNNRGGSNINSINNANKN